MRKHLLRLAFAAMVLFSFLALSVSPAHAAVPHHPPPTFEHCVKIVLDVGSVSVTKRVHGQFTLALFNHCTSQVVFDGRGTWTLNTYTLCDGNRDQVGASSGNTPSINAEDFKIVFDEGDSITCYNTGTRTFFLPTRIDFYMRADGLIGDINGDRYDIPWFHYVWRPPHNVFGVGCCP